MVEGPISPIPREARPYQGRRAGVVTRMAAAIIDALVVGGILLIAYLTVAGLRFMIDPRQFSLPEASWLLNLTVAFSTTVIYLTVAWAMSGRTYGQLVLGLRVVGARGHPLRLTGAFIRATACTVFPIGLLWCAISPEKRSLQDVLLRTSVIYDWQPRIADLAVHPPDSEGPTSRGVRGPAAGPVDG